MNPPSSFIMDPPLLPFSLYYKWKQLSTKARLDKATSLVEEMAKTLRETPEEVALAKVRGLADNLSETLNCRGIEGRLTRVEIHRKIDQRVAISLYTLFGGAVMGFYGSINSLEIDVDFQKDAVKTTNDKFDARLSAMEAKVTKVSNEALQATKDLQDRKAQELQTIKLPKSSEPEPSVSSESTAATTKGSWFGWLRAKESP